MKKTIALIALLISVKTFGCWGPEKNGFWDDWNQGLRRTGSIEAHRKLPRRLTNQELQIPQIKAITPASSGTLFDLIKQLIPFMRKTK